MTIMREDTVPQDTAPRKPRTAAGRALLRSFDPDTEAMTYVVVRDGVIAAEDAVMLAAAERDYRLVADGEEPRPVVNADLQATLLRAFDLAEGRPNVRALIRAALTGEDRGTARLYLEADHE